MKYLNLTLKSLAIICLVNFFTACGGEENSAFYYVDPNVVPEISDSVEVKSREISGKIYVYDDFFGERAEWNIGEGKIYAVFDSIEVADKRDFSSKYILAEAEIDEYGVFKLTLPSKIPPEFAMYAKDKYPDYEIENSRLITNKYELKFIVQYTGLVFGDWQDAFASMTILRDRSSGKVDLSYSYDYSFFTDESLINSSSESEEVFHVEAEKGWNVLESYEENTIARESLPIEAYPFVLVKKR